MTSFLTWLPAIAMLLTGCATVVRSTGAARYPNDGTYLLCARDGRLLQKSVWRSGTLLSGWECGDDGRWTKVASAGHGHLTYFDEEGRNIGFAEYFEGQYSRGAH